MNKLASILALVLVLVAVCATPAMAQGEGAAPAVVAAPAGPFFGAAVGIGLTVIGAAYGISCLAKAAYESMARQPEVAPAINTAMIIAAALIEGFTLFALLIFFLKATSTMQ